MKTKNENERKAIAADIFERYPKAKKVAVTSDGMAFITDENEIAVKNHSKNNRYGKELSISHFKRDEMEDEQEDKPKTAEQAGKARKTVIEAAEKRMNELKETE